MYNIYISYIYNQKPFICTIKSADGCRGHHSTGMPTGSLGFLNLDMIRTNRLGLAHVETDGLAHRPVGQCVQLDLSASCGHPQHRST